MIVALALAGATSTGCALVGSDYERPQLEQVDAMPGAASVGSASGIKVSAGEPWGRWWEVFKDPQLDALVERAREQNLDLQAAFAQALVARAVAREAFAPLLPQIGGDASYEYVRQSKNAFALNIPTPGPSQAGAAASPSQSQDAFSSIGEPFQFYGGTANLNWEIDLWGKLRRGAEAAFAERDAALEDRKAVEVAVVAALVECYFDLGELEAELAIAREDIALRDSTVELVSNRVKTGLASESALRRARAERDNAEALQLETERRRAMVEHQLAVLTGQVPTVHFDGKPPASFEVPPEVPVGIPSTLLERRPDVRAAELHVKAANAKIGEAIGRWLPSITIFGRFGYGSQKFTTLAQGNAELWNIGPGIHIPIFEGGLIQAQVVEAEALKDLAVARYREQILVAFREVADSLAGIGVGTRSVTLRRAAVVESEKAVEIATSEYRQGLESYLGVLDAQRALLAARNGLVQTQRRLLSDIVQLQRALGGGWTAAEDRPPPEKKD